MSSLFIVSLKVFFLRSKVLKVATTVWVSTRLVSSVLARTKISLASKTSSLVFCP